MEGPKHGPWEASPSEETSIKLHGIADMNHHHPTQSPSSYKVKVHNKNRLTFTIPRNHHPLTLLFHHFRLSLLTPRPPIKQLFELKPALNPSVPLRSPENPTIISRNMANYSFFSSDASLSTHRSSGPQSNGFGALVNFARHWNCCSCRNTNNVALAKEKCSICGHGKCSSCSKYYSA